MGSLNGKIAVITGGSSGIGEATARLFKQEGATVVIMGSNAAKLEHATTALGVEGVRCDVADVGSIAMAMEKVGARHGRIDILFANAGIPGTMQTIEEVDETSFDAVMTTNLKGMFFTVQKALPWMGEGGAVILTSSVVTYEALPANLPYAASKGGVRSMGRSLAGALLPRGIRVNVLTPGLFLTPIFDAMGDKRDAVLQRIIQKVPMARGGDPMEAAAAVLFLASSGASFITGTELKVSGGQTDLG